MRTAPLVRCPGTADEARELRNRYDLSVFDLRQAMDLVKRRPEYADDFLMALAWVDANGLAIHVRGDRDAWNAAAAERRVDVLFPASPPDSHPGLR